jgi:amino acid adenylation domain-containing protein/non-ribosomal peptide synthase protein (TIGR01720 family)
MELKMNANVDRRKENIETIAAVSPLQQGILFHGLRSKEQDPYSYQVVFELSGPLDQRRLTQAWQLAVDRHQVLRAEYRWEETATPLQVVFKQRTVVIETFDWRSFGAEQQRTELAQLLASERGAGFDFRHASGPKLRLIELREGVRWLTWSYHHVTLDGWSMSLVLGDTLRYYEELGAGGTVRPRPALPFTAYIDWLQKQPQEEAAAYWKQLLTGFEAPTPLPRSSLRQAPGFGEKPVRLGVADTERVREGAKAMGVTLNTLVQGAWALLLARHADQPEAIFGATVAGRGAPLAGIEEAAGLFINTLPVRVRLDATLSVADWLRGVQQQNLESRRFEHTPLIDIRRQAGLSGDDHLFASVLVFDNYPIDEALKQQPAALRVAPLKLAAEEGAQASGRNNYELTLSVSPGRQLSLTLAYHAEWFEHAHVTEIGARLERLLLELVRRPEARLGNIGLAAESVAPFETSPAAGQTRTILHAFAEQVRRTPDQTALRAEQRALSYADLDVLSDALASRLVERGVGTDGAVGLCADRSIELVVGLLGILKAGGAYVPLDAKLPAERLAELALSSGARWIVAGSVWAALASDVARSIGAEPIEIEVDVETLRRGAAPRPLPILSAEAAAYVIFTSGSTGRPKGVVVSHGALARYVSGMLARLELAPGASMGLVSTIGADLGHTVLFGALCSGATLHLIAEHRAFDPDAFAEYMAAERVGVLKIVPSHLRALLHAERPERVVPEHAVIVGGEATDWSLVEQLHRLRPGCRIINHYGPTETSVGVCTYALGEARADAPTVPMGRPLPGVELFVLDRQLERVPLEVAGELYIGGDRLARGYHAAPRATAERFVPNPFGAPGSRLYRTGDRVRRLHDGELMFIGRVDRQVKIRGYRVELGEVEARLREHSAVDQAVVVTRSSAQGGLQLVAYVAAARAAGDLSLELTTHLARQLPDYMLPSRLWVLEQLPLTANGKVDLRALPWSEPRSAEAPAPADAAGSAASQAGAALGSEAASPVEQILMDVWKEVLRVERVGLSDNFYSLGGDSILSLQVIARARRRGLKVTPKQLFEHQTVRALAAVAEQLASAPPAPTRPADSAGNVPLLPIQARFFERAVPDRQRHNQSLLLQPRQALDATALEGALRQLVEQHPSLRLAFRQEGGAWVQSYVPTEQVRQRWERRPLCWVRDLREESEIEGLADEAQGSFNLAEPPLLRAVLMRLPSGQERLLLAVHHLVVDGVSWRVLLEDLQLAYRQLSTGQPVRLSAPTSPLEHWSRALVEYAGSERLLGQREHWRRQLPSGERELRCDDPEGANRVRDLGSVRLRLSRSQTTELLTEAGDAYRTQVNDLLLAALARALCRWSGGTSALIELEGHGREDIFPALDLSRSVGWFTSAFPIRLEPAPGNDAAAVGASIKAVKEQLRNVPDRGLGYAVLRYLAARDVRDELSRLPEPRVSFNYLGQFDQSFGDDALFVPAAEPSGRGQSEDAPVHTWLAIDGQVYDGELALTLSFSQKMYRRETVEALAEAYSQELAALIGHCVAGASGVTPSDFPLAAQTQKQLDDLRLFWDDVEDLFPLSPMQQGLLLHTLLEPGSGIYLMQHDHSIADEVDVARFRQAWDQVARRHAVLRTSFVYNDDGMLQVVHRHPTIDVQLSDLRSLDAERREATLQADLERELRDGFDLRRAPLWRVRLVRMAEREFRFVFSNHHILMDAWSRARLLQDVFSAYEGLARGGLAALPPPPRYRDFIAWLAERDPEQAVLYWKHQLAGFEAATPLPWDRAPRRRAELSVVGDEAMFWSEAESAALNQLAQANQLTVNTFVQAAWALTLVRYAGVRDVLFGVTVAGRPVELPAMEQAVGLFINSIPLRVRMPRADVTVRQWLLALLDQNVSMRQHEHLPLVTIQASSEVTRGQQLFHSLFVFENAPVDVELIQSAEAMSASAIGGRTHTNYPLTVVIYPGRRVGLHLSYDERLFERSTVKAILGELGRLLGQLVAGFHDKLGALKLLPPGDGDQLQRWSAPASTPPLTRGFVELFQAQVAAHPERTAAGFRDAVLTYAELNVAANRVAHALVRRGVSLDAPVALLEERGFGLLAGVIGVFKAGGGYVPLDPHQPASRLAEILRQSQARVLVCSSTLGPVLQGVLGELGESARPEVVFLDGLAAERLPEHDPELTWHGRALAYIIFTSGSTGVPKGATVEQLGMLNNQLSKLPWLGLSETDVIAQTASQSFDISVWQLLTALTCGARVQIVPDDIAHDPGALLGHARETGISILECVPSLIGALLETREPLGPTLRVMIATGEALAPELTRRWFERHPSVPLANAYGPAECSDDVALHLSSEPLPSDVEYAPIGKPTDNNRLYVLDAALELVPVGVVGELCVAGMGVGRGYAGQPGKTAAVFVPNPFAREPGERLYRTGDLARWRPDGLLECVGRSDQQVKIRGYRVELGEIEARLREHPAVSEAVVTVHESESGKRLVGYVASSAEPVALVAELSAHLGRRLPEYMLPAHLSVLEEMPLSENGKIDRRALPQPEWAGRDDYVAPDTELGKSLAGIWRKVLGVGRVGAHDSFFELGGNSLSATLVISRIRAELRLHVPLRLMFETETLADLERLVATEGRSIELLGA